jgi:hypothetical protein
LLEPTKAQAIAMTLHELAWIYTEPESANAAPR